MSLHFYVATFFSFLGLAFIAIHGLRRMKKEDAFSFFEAGIYYAIIGGTIFLSMIFFRLEKVVEFLTAGEYGCVPAAMMGVRGEVCGRGLEFNSGEEQTYNAHPSREEAPDQTIEI